MKKRKNHTKNDHQKVQLSLKQDADEKNTGS